jgi:hypothetical protein
MTVEDRSNRRRKPRAAVETPTTVKLTLPWYGAARREASGDLVDASPGGVGIRTREPLTQGTVLSMDAQVEISLVRFRVKGQAEVANTRDTGDGVFRFGLRFLDVSWERLDPE